MNKFAFVILVLLGFVVVSLVLSSLIGVNNSAKIALIPIKGAISSSGDGLPFGTGGASSSAIVDKLEDADEDDSVKAIILEIDSPGGTVLASKEVADKIKEIEKPVVALIRGAGASGAYWIASASDYIVADELSIVGSIGVTSSYLEFSGLLKEYGVGYERLVTGEFKDIGTPYKELTDKERELFMGKLNQIHNFFVEEVAGNRNLSASKVGKLATGEIFLGQEAVKLGLVDELGGKDEAVNVSKRLANITEAEVVTYKESAGFFESLLDAKIPFQIGEGIGAVLISTDLKKPEIRA